MTQLRLLARNCEFENINSDEILRDRILLGMRDVVVRKKLLMKPKITLQDVLLACRTEELSNRHVKALHEESENVHAEIQRRSQLIAINLSDMTQGPRSQIVNSVETGMSEGKKVVRRGIKLAIDVA